VFFDEEPIYISVSSEAGGIEAAVHPLLVAMKERQPTDVAPTPQPKAEPLEELVLELTDLRFHEQDSVQRASARARLIYEPATPGQSKVHSEKAWRFIAPLGRIVFTSREALPAPFDAARHRRELHRLENDDAVKLVERALNAEGAGDVTDAAREEIEALVEAVHGHARTLALLAPTLRAKGVAQTQASLVELMADMDRQFPGSREKSLFASVELSLRRMSSVNRDRARVLGVFHGGVDLGVLRTMMAWEKADVDALAVELVGTGLANRYTDALEAFHDARERFSNLGEIGPVAAFWHQTGIVYQKAGEADAAEEAYRKSLAIKVAVGDVAAQADTLVQLGSLYYGVDRLEEAVALFRNAVDTYVELPDRAKEGFTRNNLAATLRRLSRLDEARQEIRRAIELKAQFGDALEPWIAWNVLADIERDADNPSKAAEARAKAVESYLAYRRDGGENQFESGRLAQGITESLRAGSASEAASLLEQLAADPQAASLLPFIYSLHVIVAGSRDRALADAPDLDYRMSAELLLLIDKLQQSA
jgi:tetratricopeptide (TPR) repeat protein